MPTPLVPAATYYIQNKKSGLYLRPGNPGTDDSQLVQDNLPSGNTRAFQWAVLFVDQADGEVRIFNALTGLSVDAKGNGQPPKPHTDVIQFRWRQQGNQVWEPASLNAQEFTTISSSYDAAIVWDVKDASTKPGAPVILFGKKGPNESPENQQFQFVPVASGAARIQVPGLAGAEAAVG